MTDGEIQRLYDAGHSVQQIADAAGVTRHRIRWQMKRAGIATRNLRLHHVQLLERFTPDRVRAWLRGGDSMPEIAKREGISFSWLTKRLDEWQMSAQEEDRAGRELLWQEIRAFLLARAQPDGVIAEVATLPPLLAARLLAALPFAQTPIFGRPAWKQIVEHLMPHGFTSNVYRAHGRS